MSEEECRRKHTCLSLVTKIDCLEKENQKLKKQNAHFKEAFKKPHEQQINQLKYEIAIEFESEIKKLKAALDVAREIIDIYQIIPSGKKAREAKTKIDEILNEENKNTSEFED
jgi:hypothetical protein